MNQDSIIDNKEIKKCISKYHIKDYDSLTDALKNFSNGKYSGFRPPLQAAVIDSILKGKDTLMIVSTGVGKSLCFQLSARILSQRSPININNYSIADNRRGLTIVICPLIALMEDQIKHLEQFDIAAAYMNSSNSCDEELRASLMENSLDILYISPEALYRLYYYIDRCNLKISLVAIDEIHLFSLWGHDFRPGYLLIPHFIKTVTKLQGVRPVVAGFTATADNNIIKDLTREYSLYPYDLNMDESAEKKRRINNKGRNIQLIKRNYQLIHQDITRDNLYFRMKKVGSRAKNNPYNYEKDTIIIDYIDSHLYECGIVFFSNKRVLDSMYKALINLKKLNTEINEDSNWADYPILRYYSDIQPSDIDEISLTSEENEIIKNESGILYDKILINEKDDNLKEQLIKQRTCSYYKKKIQEEYTSDDFNRGVILATNAFGTGISKKNIRYVIHYHMSDCVENYYQEVGRGGRDGNKTTGLLLYSDSDIEKNIDDLETNDKPDNESLSLNKPPEWLQKNKELLEALKEIKKERQDCLNTIIKESENIKDRNEKSKYISNYIKNYFALSPNAKSSEEEKNSRILEKASNELISADYLPPTRFRMINSHIINDFRMGKISSGDYSLKNETIKDFKGLTYFELLVADAVISLYNSGGSLNARNIMKTLTGNPNIVLEKKRKVFIEKELEKLGNTKIHNNTIDQDFDFLPISLDKNHYRLRYIPEHYQQALYLHHYLDIDTRKIFDNHNKAMRIMASKQSPDNTSSKDNDQFRLFNYALRPSIENLVLIYYLCRRIEYMKKKSQVGEQNYQRKIVITQEYYRTNRIGLYDLINASLDQNAIPDSNPSASDIKKRKTRILLKAVEILLSTEDIYMVHIYNSFSKYDYLEYGNEDFYNTLNEEYGFEYIIKEINNNIKIWENGPDNTGLSYVRPYLW